MDDTFFAVMILLCIRIKKSVLYQECEGGIEKSVPRITDWHHVACRLMTRDGFLYPIHRQIVDSFSC